VCDAQRFVLGPEVEACERAIAELAGVAHGVGVSSGSDALLASLVALGVGPGDEVVTTTFSFIATAEAIARVGARPVFVDVDPATLNIDAAAAVAALGPRTRAALPVDLFGRCADVDPLLDACAARGVPVVEDAAQAIGAVDARGRRAGSIGRCGCFSFFPSKNLGAFGDGGMVVTDDAELADRLRLLRQHGMRPKYVHATLGGNFRLDALQAAVVRAKAAHLGAWQAARRRNAEGYARRFAEAGLLDVVRVPADVPGHVYNQYVVRVPDRDRLRAHLDAAGVGTEVYYPVPLALQPCFAELGHGPGDFPVAEAAAAEVLALPIFPELAPAQQDHVVASIRAFYR
jgi:dTDP-4-amino-4,6-dideoxygalactose transaminase